MCVCVSSHSNWGTENDPDFEYHNGNKEPKGFGNVIMMADRGLANSCDVILCILLYILHPGHIGIAVPDVYKACERFEALGVNFVKKPDGGNCPIPLMLQ